MPTWKERMEHAKKLGFSPRVIIDGGAFRGVWSRGAAHLFPGAQIVLIEPNPFVREYIERNISHIQPPPKILNVALRESSGKTKFNIWREKESDTGASLLNHVSGNPNEVIEVDVETLDNISHQMSLVPDLVKLDLQGGELSALKGATHVLKHAEFMIIEFGCLEAYIGRTTPRDLLEIMYENDYCLYDIVDCHYRPYDGALTGGDFFFVKNYSVLRNYKGWE
jgi:FkbM family methyltransferase